MWIDDLAFQKERQNLKNIVAWVYSEYCRFCHDPENQVEYNRKNLKLTRKYLMWVDYLRRTIGLEVEDVRNLYHDENARISLSGDTKWVVEQYVVFYVNIESPLVEIQDSKDWIDSDKVEKEIYWSNKMAELIGAAVGDLDRSLRRVPSYSHEMEGVEVRIQRVGNYLLVYVPERHDVIKSMYALMILRNTEFFRELASRGTFVRGAFTRGLGWELQSGQGRRTLYGPVMADSYKLMTDIAWKPRLVVEESIFKIISDRSSYGPGKDGDWLPLYAERDFDGVGFVKYVAFDEEFACSHLKESCETIEDLKKARDITRRYIQVLANRYEKCDYSEHVQRLVPLQEEFSNAIDEWSKGLSSL